VLNCAMLVLQAEYLAVGEAPEELRNMLRQRSRWTKGHMQVRGVTRLPAVLDLTMAAARVLSTVDGACR
jgi:cellulose synthase/poly-beta-1,6-N-acetylglucosamine synthase-like glycosyltransferase